MHLSKYLTYLTATITIVSCFFCNCTFKIPLSMLDANPSASSSNSGVRKFLVTDSGVLSCFDATTTQTCVSVTATYPNQDGHFVNIPNARSFSGPNPDAMFPSDYVTKDNVTNLTWKSCTEGLTGATCAGGAANGSLDQAGAVSTCSALNSQNAGSGYANLKTWRLPTVEELLTIPNYSTFNPSIDTGNFPNTQPNDYWSSTSLAGSPSQGWIVNLNVGIANNTTNTNTGPYTRCVAGQSFSLGTYLDNGDGTITDQSTDLRWQKCSMGFSDPLGCASGSASTSDWQSALSYCKNLTLASRSWRLPNISELRSLIDTSRSLTTINITNFPNTVANFYWSSTSYVSGAAAWYVNFNYGAVTNNAKTNPYYARCVSTGP